MFAILAVFGIPAANASVFAVKLAHCEFGMQPFMWTLWCVTWFFLAIGPSALLGDTWGRVGTLRPILSNFLPLEALMELHVGPSLHLFRVYVTSAVAVYTLTSKPVRTSTVCWLKLEARSFWKIGAFFFPGSTLSSVCRMLCVLGACGDSKVSTLQSLKGFGCLVAWFCAYFRCSPFVSSCQHLNMITQPRCLTCVCWNHFTPQYPRRCRLQLSWAEHGLHQIVTHIDGNNFQLCREQFPQIHNWMRQLVQYPSNPHNVPQQKIQTRGPCHVPINISYANIDSTHVVHSTMPLANTWTHVINHAWHCWIWCCNPHWYRYLFTMYPFQIKKNSAYFGILLKPQFVKYHTPCYSLFQKLLFQRFLWTVPTVLCIVSPVWHLVPRSYPAWPQVSKETGNSTP